MSDPGGSHGWRSAPHLPAGTSRRARFERALARDETPLLVVLLDGTGRGEDLLAAPGAVGVDPARLSYRAAARLPVAVADGLAAVQARRLGLPGFPRAIVLLDPLAYPLARALLGHHPDAQLWYAGAPAAGAASRAAPLHALAEARADARIALPADGDLWTRVERLGIASGRLGSERPDVR